MTDIKSNEEKEAIEKGLNLNAIYRGIQLCTVAITRADDWITHDDGSITGPGYTTAVAPSDAVKALIDAFVDAKPPVDVPPPPAPPAPIDPPKAVLVLTANGRTVTASNESTGTIVFSEIAWDDGSQLPSEVKVGESESRDLVLDGLRVIALRVVGPDGRIDRTISRVTIPAAPPVPSPPVPIDPPAPPSPPSPPAGGVKVVSQTLTADKDTVMVGDHVTFTAILNLSDGATKPVTAHAFGWDPALLSAPNGWTHRFLAIAPGVCKVSNSNSGTTGRASVTIIKNDGTVFPPDPPPVVKPPAPPVDPVDPPVDVPPPAAIPPSHPDVTSDTVTLDVRFGSDPLFTRLARKGERIQLVLGDPFKGSLVYYGDGLCACIENCWPSGDLSGVFTLKAGETVLFDGPLTIYAKTRTRPFWLSQPTVRPDADLSAFPAYGAGSESSSSYAAYLNADNSPMGRGLASAVQGMTGEQDTLGPLTKWGAQYITNPSAENAAVVRGMADSACVWGYHLIDPKTGKMLSTVDYPRASMLGVQIGGAGNPVPRSTTANPNKVDYSASHAPVFCALACELFGTDYDREELALWGNYCGGLYQNYAYRLPCGYNKASNGQTRAKGRGLVVVLYAAKYSDNTAYFQNWLDNIPADMTATWLSQSGIHVDQRDIPYPHSGIAPWQQDILGYAIGLALQHGHTAFQPILDYFAETLMDRILSAPHELATIYEVAIRGGAGVSVDDWAGALALAATYSPGLAAALQQPEGSQALMDALQRTDLSQAGDFIGYPTSPTGYAAMMQPFVAMVADHATDQTRARAAWTKFMQWRRIDARANPKYNIVPRA